MAHRVDSPRVLDDEEGDPLPLIGIDEERTAREDSDSIDNEKGDIEFDLVLRIGEIISHVQKPAFYHSHDAIVGEWR